MDDSPLEHVSKAPESMDGPAPAVVLVHGRGADERDLLALAAELPEELHVLSVRAPDRLQGGYTWYDLQMPDGDLHASQPDDEGFRRSLDLLHEFVDWAVEEYDLDPDRIGLLGFSQGAITSLAALCERPGSYAWVVALHGYLADSHEDRADNAAGESVFIGAGESDRIIPPERARRAADRLAGASVDLTFDTYPVGHGIHPEELGDVVEWLSGRL